MATLGNPKNTIAVLQKYQFNFQKKFGQNFLIDPHVLDKIIRAAEITEDDFVLEIGPGMGTMTQYLACAARKVVAVEIDKALIPILEDTLSDYDNARVINNDVLKVDIAKLAEEENGGKPIKVVANLPYYITTPIIMGLFENHVPIKSITVMVQKEVADRMQVGPGTKDYGALSLAVQYYAKPYRNGQDNSQPGVPYRTSPEIEPMARNTVEEVYTKIHGDLDEALNLLADYEPNDKNHYSLASVYGLKARALLTQQKYACLLYTSDAADD